MDTLEALKASNGIDETSLIDGLWQVHAIARFDTAGALVTANTAFQTLLGLDRAALRGATHHDVCSGHLRRGDEHALFWASLMAGTPRQCELTLGTTAIRVQGAHPATGAREPEAAEVWVRASYIPARDSAGIVTGVVMFATDITAEKQAAAKAATLAAAMNRSYAIVEFDLSGQILGANDNFLHLMGYRSSEIVGRHHSIFCEESYAQSDAYQRFWSQLSAGRHEVGEFMRIGQDCANNCSIFPDILQKFA